VRRRAPLIALIIASVLAPAASLWSTAAPATAAHHDAATGRPSVEVYAGGGGIVTDGHDLTISVVIANPSTETVDAGHVSVAVTSRSVSTPTALRAFESAPAQSERRTLGSATTTAVEAGGTQIVATVTVPAASVHLPASNPGVFGLSATVTTAGGTLGTGASTLVVPGATPAKVGIAAVMPVTVPPSADGIISAQDLATYTGADGVLTRELTIAQRNPELTLGIDPMVLVSIRALGRTAPPSAGAWIEAMNELSNPTFPLQYGDADPGLQTQAGLAKPLQPTDFSYAMSAGDVATPPTVGEPTGSTPSPGDTPTATPTPTATATNGAPLPTLDQLTGWPYSLSGIAWPAPGTVRSADIAAFGRAGMPTTIVSTSNTNAALIAGTPNPVLPVSGGTALVTDDNVSGALTAAATASDPITASVTSAELQAQLALAAQNAHRGGIVLATLGRVWPTDASRAATVMTTLLDSRFSTASTVRDALTAPPTEGLKLTDKRNAAETIDQAGALLDLAGETRSGGVVPSDNIAQFSSVLSSPELLTGDVRARLLTLFSAGWATSGNRTAAAAKELSSLAKTLDAVQIVAPESIRQTSRQALIPITVTNQLAHPVDVVLRATPSSTRLKVESDTEKTIPAGSSVKVLVPVKSQLSNGSVWLGLQLYSKTGVVIGTAKGAEIDVHADWEGIGALIFGVVVVVFFGWGVLRTVQRRRREKANGDTDHAVADVPEGDDADAPAGDGVPRG
jgi:hypothetical protein